MARRKKKVKPGLLIDSDEQLELMDKSMEQQVIEGGEVKCLGMKFPNDEERRKFFLDILREKLKDPSFRKFEGFPIGEDEDILALSDPPYYTACPNPFIEDFIKHYGKPYDPENDNYKREPFAADVSEGKNDPIYNAHSYHTKVPHKAIMRYILHYTEPGDIVYDGFCGTGVTGVAAQLCGDKKTVESLGYKVDANGVIFEEVTNEEGKSEWKSFSKLGPRIAVLYDLSPAATFIAYNYNTPVDISEFEREAKHILKEVEEEYGWMYETIHTDGKTKGNINYTVWSDVYLCPECTEEIVFWDVAIDTNIGKVRNEFACSNCNAILSKRGLLRAWMSKYDKLLNKTIQQYKKLPVFINYSIGRKRMGKTPDSFDLERIDKIENFYFGNWIPVYKIIDGQEIGRLQSMGINYTHQLFPTRTNIILGEYLSRCKQYPRLRLMITSTLLNLSWMYRWRANGKGGTTSGTYYICATPQENNAFKQIRTKIENWLAAQYVGNNIISCQDSGHITIENDSVDYIFLDPPFGANLMYSELNYLWESWLKIWTHNKSEAIENEIQYKGIDEYRQIMTNCFKETYRILKPGRWMTVEFHNSKNSVWNAIQEAIQYVGFVIADIRTLDKKQGSFKQVTSGGAVKQDLIISAYKPNDGLERRFHLSAGTEDGVWDFIRTHLKQLPKFVSKDNEVEIVSERQNYLLFDRMVAFHVQRGVSVPISAGDFYKGLAQRFPERDGMYFLPEQVAEYDKKRMSVNKVLQLQLFVNDEASAIQWLKQQLSAKPQTFQDIHPVFMRELGGWQKHEKPLELSDLLAENFLRYDGKEDVPSQIHSYLSSNFKELRNLQKDDPKLKAKAKDRWYVPDPNKAGDLEKLRERSLLKEFEEYKESTQRKLKVFRLEAIRAGFKKAWQEKDYKTIIEISKKIPDNVLQEDSKLLMWYDQALTRSGEE